MIEFKNVRKTYVIKNSRSKVNHEKAIETLGHSLSGLPNQGAFLKTKSKKAKTTDLHAVDGIDLVIHDGEIFGIIGYSGAGKSTMIRLINQLEKQTSGQIFIDGKDLSTLKEKELLKARSKIGMIFQHFNLLWSRTVFDNIALPLEIVGMPKEERNKKVSKLIDLVGLSGRENAYPNELSGGQKQRVGIARALANDPSILLCDEATSALDPETTETILELIQKINKELGITVVIITHQMQVVQKVCHRIAVVSQGKIVELGSVQQIFENPKNDVTKRFIKDVEGYENVEKIRNELKTLYPNGHLIRLQFTNQTSDEPVLSRVIRQTHLDISIVHGNINQSISGKVGSLYVHVSCDKQEFEELKSLFEKQQVKVEVI